MCDAGPFVKALSEKHQFNNPGDHSSWGEKSDPVVLFFASKHPVHKECCYRLYLFPQNIKYFPVTFLLFLGTCRGGMCRLFNTNASLDKGYNDILINISR